MSVNGAIQLFYGPSHGDGPVAVLASELALDAVPSGDEKSEVSAPL